MARYMLFIRNREYEQGSVEDHLSELSYRSMMTPDHWASFDDLADAIYTACAEYEGMVVVDEYGYKILYKTETDDADEGLSMYEGETAWKE